MLRKRKEFIRGASLVIQTDNSAEVPLERARSLSGDRLLANQSTSDTGMDFQPQDPRFIGIRPVFENINLVSVRTEEIVANLLDNDIEVLFYFRKDFSFPALDGIVEPLNVGLCGRGCVVFHRATG